MISSMIKAQRTHLITISNLSSTSNNPNDPKRPYTISKKITADNRPISQTYKQQHISNPQMQLNPTTIHQPLTNTSNIPHHQQKQSIPHNPTSYLH
jgi:hypothetical protein